jgi:hypothetical protein
MRERLPFPMCFAACLCALATTVSACRIQRPTATSRAYDSADVQIVEASLPDASPWALSPEPVLDLSTSDDSTREFFHVTDGIFLSDSAIAIVNAGTYQVRVFAPDGTLESEFGRAGDGPGEFRGPYRIFEVPGTGLAVHDIFRATLSLFDRAGHLLITASLPHVAVWSVVLGWLQEDRVLLGYWTVAPLPQEFQQQFTQYLSYSWTNGIVDSLARIPSGTIGFIGGLEPWGVIGGALFEAQAHAATVAGLAILGDGAVPELRLVDRQGVLKRILRWHHDPQPVSAGDLEAYRTATLGESPDPADRSMMRKQLAATPASQHFPAFADIRSDRDGRIWIQSYVRPGARTQLWHVVRLDSKLIAALELPLRTQLLDAASDKVLVVEPDEFDVEHVRLYRIRQR